MENVSSLPITNVIEIAVSSLRNQKVLIQSYGENF